MGDLLPVWPVASGAYTESTRLPRGPPTHDPRLFSGALGTMSRERRGAGLDTWLLSAPFSSDV